MLFLPRSMIGALLALALAGKARACFLLGYHYAHAIDSIENLSLKSGNSAY
jgi:hypothetical protein